MCEDVRAIYVSTQDDEEEGLDEREPPPESGSPNRRASARYGVVWAVDCETEETFLYAKITNISELGIFVRTVEPLPVGTRVSLRFSPTHVVMGDFALEGQVQWINPATPTCPNPGMGVRFSELTLDDRERLVEVIRTIAYLPEYVGAS